MFNNAGAELALTQVRPKSLHVAICVLGIAPAFATEGSAGDSWATFVLAVLASTACSIVLVLIVAGTCCLRNTVATVFWVKIANVILGVFGVVCMFGLVVSVIAHADSPDDDGWLPVIIFCAVVMPLSMALCLIGCFFYDLETDGKSSRKIHDSGCAPAVSEGASMTKEDDALQSDKSRVKTAWSESAVEIGSTDAFNKVMPFDSAATLESVAEQSEQIFDASHYQSCSPQKSKSFGSPKKLKSKSSEAAWVDPSTPFEADLPNAVEEDDETVVSLISAITSGETIELRDALETARQNSFPETHEKVVEAKTKLATLDAALAAYTELVRAMKEEADIGNLRRLIESAAKAGVEDHLVSAAASKLKQMELQEAARAKLESASVSRDAGNLCIALEEASYAGLRGDAPPIVRAKSSLREIEASQELESAMEAADMPRLKASLEAGRLAGVPVDKLLAGEAAVNELDRLQAARSKLKKASTTKDPEMISVAIAQAQAAGCSTSDASLIEATRLLESEKAAAESLQELDVAIGTTDVQRLTQALDHARTCSVPADRIAVAEKKLAQLLAQASALESLSSAIDMKNISALRTALQEAASAGLSIDHEQVVVAQSTLAEADAVLAASAELDSASKAGDIERLQDAIQKGRSAGLDPVRLSEAEATLTTLEAHAVAVAAAAAELEAAVSGVAESVERLHLAIKNATDLDAVPDNILREAAATLAAEEKKRKLQKDLELASASRNIEMISAALEAAQTAGLAQCPQLEEAHKIVHEEGLKEEARQELLRCVQQEDKNIEQLRNALEKAETVGVAGDDESLMDAKEVLANEEAKLVALAELADAAQEGDKVDSKDPFGLEKARDRLIGGIAYARELGITEGDITLRGASVMRRKLHNMLQDLLGATRVFCRVRPANSREKRLESPLVVDVVDGMSVELTDEDGENRKFEFDAAFGPTSTQEQIFDECKDLVQSVLDGYNITIFAYGQTGAGKTFTMMGVDEPPELKGVCPRTIDALFEALERESTRSDVTVTAFMVEVYCSKINDLGDVESAVPTRSGRQGRAVQQSRGDRRPSTKDNGIKVRFINNKVVLEGVCERAIDDAGDLFQLLEDGNNRKKVTATAMNAGSSRSHTVLGINVLVRNKETKKEHAGKILLVDLAGSERLKKSEVTGAARTEAIEINKSLTALGDVISAITLGKRVPFRNHALTMLMSDSLGGSAKTLLFVNASPALDNADETIMALNFATRAKTITSREAAVVSIQAVRRGIVDRREVTRLKSGEVADVALAVTEVDELE